MDTARPAFAHWFAGRDFTVDWCSAHFPRWAKTFAHLALCKLRILEIGSWEGRSAIFFLEFFPKCHLVCVDTFKGSPDEHLDEPGLPDIEARFDRNLAPYVGRFEKRGGRSASVMDQMRACGERFDLIYIDGSHRRADVLIDSLMAWEMLTDGGWIVWDDYLWLPERPVSERPQQAIEMFLSMNADHLAVDHIGLQVIAQKQRRSGLATRPLLQIPRTPRNLRRFLTKTLEMPTVVLGTKV